jgi:cytochrome c
MNMKCLLQSILLVICIAGNQPLTYAESDSDRMAGERLYQQCIGCHAPAYHRTGPMHCNLIGRRAGSIEGYEFTDAMKRSGIIWSVETLDVFLQSPFKIIPGTSMGYAGIASAKEREQLINYIVSLDKQNPLCREQN